MINKTLCHVLLSLFIVACHLFRTCEKDLQKGLAKRTNSISFLVCMSSIALSMNAMVLALSMNNNIRSQSLL